MTDRRQYIASIGGERVVREMDVEHLKAGVRRVYEVMQDGEWHSIEELRERTGQAQADRRMRELRAEGFVIEKHRVGGSRLWLYQLQVPEPEPKQLHLLEVGKSYRECDLNETIRAICSGAYGGGAA